MNYEQNVQHATSVGVYPCGATADGICDMAGNVWEWCWDWYNSYLEAEQRNPRGPDAGSSRVLRGGSWRDYHRLCRGACRSRRGPPWPSQRHRFSGGGVVVLASASQSSPYYWTLIL
jgi:formylglycine-generating enzyme required for sulfatase activity